MAIPKGNYNFSGQMFEEDEYYNTFFNGIDLK